MIDDLVHTKFNSHIFTSLHQKIQLDHQIQVN